MKKRKKKTFESVLYADEGRGGVENSSVEPLTRDRCMHI